ncbi:hypothetical protein CHS0354_013311 [Potamilus streckersoni]|uniref:Uncharacterized protein n=1 Tax=Potamilus streckersoni TaxID=2493646 RepID=A0AAE0SAC9_9BIVA|nr:hypothetical protein CHS0354_013311 [Potamilus streckersoni]
MQYKGFYDLLYNSDTCTNVNIEANVYLVAMSNITICNYKNSGMGCTYIAFGVRNMVSKLFLKLVLVDDGYITHVQNENEITIQFNPNGYLVDEHGYLRLFDENQTKSIQGDYEGLKRTNVQMKISIFILVGLFLLALCAFLLSYFCILPCKGPECPDPPEPPKQFSCPVKYTFFLGENASVACVLPKLVNYTSLYVDQHKTRVSNQDKRLLQVGDVYQQDSVSTDSGRISTRMTGSQESISILIAIHVTHCDDHGYILINISGGIALTIVIEVNASYTPCPQTALFQWNTTEWINCSACIGNTTWNVIWHREGKGIYIPYLEKATSFIDGSNIRMVPKVKFALGVIHFNLLNQRVFCSDGGMYSAAVYVDHTILNFTIKVDVNGFIESCNGMWEIKLIDLTRKACSICIGETEDAFNVSIFQDSVDISTSSSVQLLQGQSNINKFRDFLTIETYIDAGVLKVLFGWSRVQCIDSGFYLVEARGRYGTIQRNISIVVDELAFLKVPKIVQEDGLSGGFAEGFNLTLTCTVENIGCKKREIFLSLGDRNTTTDCKNIALGANNINESYACSLAWTEVNISRDFNGTSFYCGYNYTHYNETLLIFRNEIQVFVIPGNFCEEYEGRCYRPHPLGGRFFIECDAKEKRPWEFLCQEKLVFRHGPGECNGRCDYP